MSPVTGCGLVGVRERLSSARGRASRVVPRMCQFVPGAEMPRGFFVGRTDLTENVILRSDEGLRCRWQMQQPRGRSTKNLFGSGSRRFFGLRPQNDNSSLSFRGANATKNLFKAGCRKILRFAQNDIGARCRMILRFAQNDKKRLRHYGQPPSFRAYSRCQR